MKTYDLESVYDEKISPLMAEIIAICKEHKMPMLASFQFRYNEEEQSSFCTTRLHWDDTPESENLSAATKEIYRKPSFYACAITVSKGE
jgi:hypothetical protein